MSLVNFFNKYAHIVYQENDLTLILTLMHLISRIINKTEIDLSLRILSAILLSQITKHFDLSQIT